MLDQIAGVTFSKELTWDPVRIAQPGAWAGHIPFAFWVVKALRPAVFVELGTHSGNSYFAFCQAMNVFCPGARAFAVDTWQGDDHAGHYGEDVYADVARFNEAHFGQFSTLIRNTFDAARNYFAGAGSPRGAADGGIDLLHIDGLHSYEAVRHDFDTWRDALSSRGVVLFHDINVRERDFGVWKLWDELRREYPGFAFDHSNGLGVLGVGQDQDPELHALYGLSAEAAARFRRRIAARGEAFQRQADILALREQVAVKDAHIVKLTAHQAELSALVGGHAEARAEVEALRGRMAVVEAQHAEVSRASAWQAQMLASQREQVQARDAMVAVLDNVAAARAAALAERDRIINERDQLAMRLTRELQEQRHQSSRMVMETQHAQRERDQMVQQLAQTQAEAQQAVQAVQQEYVRSTSWRLTRPLRVGMRLVRHGRLRPVSTPPSPNAVAPSALPPPESAPAAPDAPAPAKAALHATLSAQLEAFLATPARLRLPSAESPDVSIVLVLYNQAELTFGCLGSIMETLVGTDLGIELILLDNASIDRTAELLDRIDGAKIIRGDTNLHFLKGVNRAARAATGRTLLLLNNDTQLLPGAVAAALRTLDSAEDIGAVGGRIILPDGTLQEAGSILWNTGAVAGYGRGQDPNGPDVMFQRNVDYCSGTFLLTPMSAWHDLNGFDEAFAPAYYAETDYCVRLWKSGRRVVFDPDVTILQYDFASSGSVDQALALQEANHRIFVQRHREWLDGQFSPGPLNVLAARTARSDGPRVLVIEDRVPKVELGSGYPRANRLLHELVEAGAEVTLFSTHRVPETWQTVRRALDKRIEVLIKSQADQIRAYLDARREHFDVIIVCRPHNMAALEAAVGFERDLIGRTRVIYDAEALFVTRDLQQRVAAGTPTPAAERHRLIAAEASLTRLADSVLSVSAAERETLEEYGAKEVLILAHALDEEPLEAGFEERERIVFLGAIHQDNTPNADAVRWFAQDILPGIRRVLDPETRLSVVGMNRDPSIAAMDGDQLDLRGMVEDLRAALADARVMVVPTRLGAGIPHKVHQAAALGIPMVVTKLIADQLGWQDECEVLVADDGAAFAAAVARLYRDAELWERLRRTALERVRVECAPRAFRAQVRATLANVPIIRRRVEHAPPRNPPPPASPAEPCTSRTFTSDYSMSVPFDFPPMQAPAPRIAVIAHLFYPEAGPEMRFYLRNLPVPANLFLSTDTPEKAAVIRATFAEWTEGRVEVRVTPNRGRDIAPKLVGFRDAYADHDLVLHLHSKQSYHAPFLVPWRSFLFEHLLGSRQTVSSILDAFARLPRLGMVAPQHYESIRRWLGWNGNFALAQDMARRMGIALSPTRALDFPSGSMFWARPAALKPLLDLGLSFDDFPAEGSQLDHTPAHVIERLYFLACERSGHAWLKISDPTLHLNTSTIVTIQSPVELERFLTERGVLLTGPMDLPVASTQPHLITRIPPGLVRRLTQREI